ncbi:hypothetical protein [Bradyrhizobium sp.]|uniref:hypothetical protein n=1 Tax=Bradyrhizobium sp. TaxID=376 RepID=UPI00271C420E|nr:hypothetical protein [Bradyrhizobium sp.]MDO9295231.1 hypothetical protein [Bradyrhizobium sp.]
MEARNYRAELDFEQLLRTADSELAVSGAGIASSARRQRSAARRRAAVRSPAVPPDRAGSGIEEEGADAADEAELDDIYETERRLLYVACTRAREHLLLTGVAPGSEYLGDFDAKSN